MSRRTSAFGSTRSRDHVRSASSGMRNFSVYQRFAMIIAALTIVLFAVSALQILVLRDAVLDERRTTVRDLVDAATKVLAHYESEAKAGRIEPDKARQMAFASISAMDLVARHDAAWRLRRDPYLLETSVPGVFAAGDVRHGSIKRVAAGVGEGSMAIAFVHPFLAEDAAVRAPVPEPAATA